MVKLIKKDEQEVKILYDPNGKKLRTNVRILNGHGNTLLETITGDVFVTDFGSYPDGWDYNHIQYIYNDQGLLAETIHTAKNHAGIRRDAIEYLR